MRTPMFLAAFALSAAALAGPVVRVSFDESVRKTAASGRLVVLMKSTTSTLGKEVAPLDGPFWEEGQPLFAMDVKDLKPGQVIEVGEAADAFPAAISTLEPGEYEVQARLDVQRLDSEWKREPGNLFTSARATLKITTKGGDAAVDLKLDTATKPIERPDTPGVEWFSVRSELLSKFRGTDVVMRAGVVLPKNYDPAKQYAAVYEVPGFGGNDEGARGVARRNSKKDDGLATSAFWIVLDPEGPNGHTLFADSANNGPCGRALVEELIPALEKKFPLIAKPEARLLRGHSSGGWSTLWLATEYPTTFGACWSSSPDPVDFRAFQLVDIYDGRSMYAIGGFEDAFNQARANQHSRIMNAPASLVRVEPVVPDGDSHIVSYRRNGKPIMTVVREARGEDILGPDNTSGQQWDSWFAAFGPRNANGNPAALFDPMTGAIDHAIAEKYRPFDIADHLRKDPAKCAPIFRNNIRLVVGGADNFFLEQAVTLLKKDLDGMKSDENGPGFITIVPDLDHSTIFGSPELKAFESQMLEHLTKHGLAR